MKENTLCNNLEYLINITGLSTNQLSKKSGVSQPTLHRMLLGTTTSPRRDSLIALANFFNISVAQLTGHEKLPPLASEAIKENFSIQKIPVITWESIKKWKENFDFSDYPFEKIILDKELDKNSFAVIYNNSNLVPLFYKDSLLIFDPSVKPSDKSFALVYIKETDSIEFNRLIEENGIFYLKKEFSKDNIRLVQIKENIDKIIAILVESRTSF